MRGTRETVAAVYTAYAARDIDGALSNCTDSMCFVWNANDALEPYCGECHGKAAFLEKLQTIDTEWEVIKYAPVEIICEGNSAAARVRIEYRNKSTGKTLETELGHFWQIEDGQAAKLIEFYDTATVLNSLT